MAKRLLRDWTDSERIHQLSAEAERFFTRLIMKADDFGRYVGNPKLLKASLFPLHETLTDNDILIWLDECSEASLLNRYTVDGKGYLEIYGFDQKLKVRRAKYPPSSPEERQDLIQGYVYVIGESFDAPVKIGFSMNPWSRLKEINTNYPGQLNVLLSFKADKKVESLIHKELKHLQVKNEWFNLTEHEVNVFKSVSDGTVKAENIFLLLRSNDETLRGTTLPEVEVEVEVEDEVEREGTRDFEFADENVPRELKIELPDKNKIFEEIFSDELFVEELGRSHPKKNLQRAWEECWLWHSQKPSPPTLGWQWRQKLSTWLINTKNETSKKTDAINSRRQSFAKRHSSGS